MKVQIYGKITKRSQRTTDKGAVYYIEIDEPGQYPSVFQLGSKDVTIFGKPDGPFAVGKMVTATAFCNGKASDVTGKDGRPFRAYRVWFNLTKLESAEAPAMHEPSAPDVQSAEPEDIPF